MINSLFDISYVLSNRRDLSKVARFTLIWDFLAFSLLHKILKPSNHVRFMGYTFFFRTYANLHTILKEVFFFGEYVPHMHNEKPFIIDCGGNIGVTTLFLKQLFPKAKMLVFEPSVENFKTLQQNIEKNNLVDVQAVRAAVCDTEGEITFWDDQKKPGSATSTEAVIYAKDSTRFRQETVPAVKLSRFIDRPIDMLKMDIEGGESIVLQELDRSGKLAQISEIVFEYHMSPSNTSNSLTKVVEILERNGFNVIPFGIDLSKDGFRIASRSYYHFMLRAVRP